MTDTMNAHTNTTQATRTAGQDSGTAHDTGAVSAAEAAAGLGAELVRFKRVLTVWRQGVKPCAADRVLLAHLVRQGAQRATDLANDAYLDLSTVSRQVRSLVERGLVERHPDPEDRRGSLLSATDAGRKAFEQYVRQRDVELTRLLEPWPAEDRYQLIRLLKRLNNDLVEYTHAPHGDGTIPGGAAAEQGEQHA